MKTPVDRSKRMLLKGGVVLASGALGSVLPLGAALAADTSPKKPVYKSPLFDPTLENYPGYSTYVPIPRSAELASAGHNLLDTQFIV
ncbi:MAG: hypothetical protein RLZZ227_956 [Pseudomonadota bacterium]